MIDPIDTIDPYDTTLMGPGFFVFFQRNIIESGGYPADGAPEVYQYRPRVRFKFADEEEKKAAEAVEDVVEALASKESIDKTEDDLELILRLKLQILEIRFETIYLIWLQDEYCKYLKQRREAELFLLLLH